MSLWISWIWWAVLLVDDPVACSWYYFCNLSDSVRLIDGMICLIYWRDVIDFFWWMFWAWSNAILESVMMMYG